jgi:uncharacterized protein YegP (UPF0339 family)
MHFVLSRVQRGRWTWLLRGRDEQQVVQGRNHSSRMEAMLAVGLVQGTPGNGCRFKVPTNRSDGAWSWRLVTRNGWVVAQGSANDDSESAERARRLLAGTSRATPVQEPDLPG